ncbi:MAG: MucR family transcriptional regulator [Proteobacteria bacterium]|nr:MucR family transcriptional regulator [Pseudomonadota bacterium]
MSDRRLLALVANITTAYCTGNHVAIADLPAFMASVFSTLDGLSKVTPPAPPLKPAVPVRESVKPDYIVCLEDGKKLKMLKRHLRTAFNLTPDQYRAKWDLRRDYPMVAPSYSMTRSKLALACGLGRGRITPVPTSAVVATILDA